MILLVDLVKDKLLSEGLLYHINNKKPLSDNVYRPDSNKFFELFREARFALKECYIDNLSKNKINKTYIRSLYIYSFKIEYKT